MLNFKELDELVTQKIAEINGAVDDEINEATEEIKASIPSMVEDYLNGIDRSEYIYFANRSAADAVCEMLKQTQQISTSRVKPTTDDRDIPADKNYYLTIRVVDENIKRRED